MVIPFVKLEAGNGIGDGDAGLHCRLKSGGNGKFRESGL